MLVPHRRRAAGFTLIELLVVIAILAVLAALGAGAYFRVRANQQIKTTEDTVSKVQSGLANQWSAELDSANDAFDGKNNLTQFVAQANGVRQIAGGDPDRARSLWKYLWMANAFPQTVAAATSATTLSVQMDGSMPPTTITVSLPARKAYSTLPTGLNAPEQAAAVLFLALTQKGTRGQVFDVTANGTLTKNLNSTGPTVFTDTFGNPISFVRMSSGILGDASSQEYLKAGANPDPLDPSGRMRNWPAPTTNPPPVSPKMQVAAAFGLSDFNTNWMYTAVSRSTAQDWGTFLSTTTGIVPVPEGYVVGYKLRRQGAGGDK